MKTDRFSSAFTRAAAVLLAGLLLAAGAAGQTITFRFKTKGKGMAAVLALQVKAVQQRFDTNRLALRSIPGLGGEPAYLRQEVAGLIDRTEEDLDKAIEQIGEPGLDGLRAWAAEELRQIQDEIAVPPVRTASLSSARVSAADPQQETIPAGTTNRLLDQVGAVAGRIFFIAKRDDLEVKLWVGSTVPRAKFSFWPKGKIKGSAAAPTIIRTNGKRDHVLRGLYSYQAAWAQGAMIELVEYPTRPAGAPAAQSASERLDLVTSSSFFCCRFNEQYCHHVDDKKECRP